MRLDRLSQGFPAEGFPGGSSRLDAVRIGVGIDTARYGHRVSFLRPDQIDYTTAARVGLLPAAVDVRRIWERIQAEARSLETSAVRPRKSKAVKP
jgi:hypothetical protein